MCVNKTYLFSTTPRVNLPVIVTLIIALVPLFPSSKIPKKFFFCSMKTCKQFVKGDENISPVLKKDGKNAGVYFVYHFYFCA